MMVMYIVNTAVGLIYTKNDTASYRLVTTTTSTFILITDSAEKLSWPTCILLFSSYTGHGETIHRIIIPFQSSITRSLQSSNGICLIQYIIVLNKRDVVF